MKRWAAVAAAALAALVVSSAARADAVIMTEDVYPAGATPIVLIGQIGMYTSCADPSHNDSITPTADLYVVPSPFSGLLVGTPIPVVGPTFTELPISSVAKVNAVVIDQCQNGVYDPFEDTVFDPAFSFADAGITIPSLTEAPDMTALKERARQKAEAATGLEHAWMAYAAYEVMADAYEIASKVGTVRTARTLCANADPVITPFSTQAICLYHMELEAEFRALKMFKAFNFMVSSTIELSIRGFAQHWEHVANDPPDPSYAQPTVLAPIAPPPAQASSAPLAAAARLNTELEVEANLTLALVTALERYQGSAAAGDPEWALAHAREVDRYAGALASQLDRSDAAATSFGDAVAADTTDIASLAGIWEPFRALVVQHGTLGAETRRALMNDGYASAQVDQVEQAFAGESFAYDPSLIPPAVTGLVAANATTRFALTAFAASARAAAAQLAATPGVVDQLPRADAGGPYALGDDTLALDASASTAAADATLTSYAWDLDGDGEFDDASGATTTVAVARVTAPVIGVRVTDSRGRAAVAYAAATPAWANTPPVITASAPDPAVTTAVGASVVLTVAASDADGDPPATTWSVDGFPIAAGSTFLFTPAAAGLHVVDARVSDGRPGGLATRRWLITGTRPDGDGDGWNANADCDDGDAAVSPGHAEVTGNGKDDDCNPATKDAGSGPTASFVPDVGSHGRNVLLLEAGALALARSSQYDALHTPEAMINADGDEFYPWATAFGQTTNQFAILQVVDGGSGQAWLIDRVLLRPRAGCCFDQRVKDFEVDVSTTDTSGAAWTTVLHATAADNGNLQEFVLPQPAFARFVRYRPLTNRGAPYLSTHQLKALTPQQSGDATVRFRDTSVDPDNDVVSRAWDFGDGSTGSGATPTHTYAAAGTYHVTLTVTDRAGNRSSYALDQRVLGPPTASIVPVPASPNEGQEVSLALPASSPNGAIVTAKWNFGDGTSATSMGAIHTFRRAGSYTVSVDVTDVADQTVHVERVVTVQNLAPRIVIPDDGLEPVSLPWLVATGKPLQFTPTVTDGGGVASCRWSFGDGGVSNVCAFAHSYSTPGTYTATLSATDVDGATSIGTTTVRVFAAPSPVVLQSIATNFNGPIGIDYHQPTNSVVVSANYPTGLPSNFERIELDGTHRAFSSIARLTEEVKIAAVRSSSCQGGFQPGELFVGTGTPGVIARISPDGSSIQNPWVTLPGETGLLRGSLFQDRFCAFGGDLLAVTTTGGIWRVTSGGVPTNLGALGVHLEGITTVPNDEARYGPWAGKLLIGAEEQSLVWSIGPDRVTRSWNIGIAPEDIDVVPPNENFFGVAFASGRIMGAPASAFADKVGDIVFAQEFPGSTWDVRWNSEAAMFEPAEIAPQVGQWEHVTFAGAGITPIPPSNHVPVATGATLQVPKNGTRAVTLAGTDADGDALTFAVASPPAHGTFGGGVYTPVHGYAGPDSFTFAASDGKAVSQPATVTLNVVNAAPVALDGAAATDEDTPHPLSLQATDASGDTLTYRVVGAPAHGTFEGGVYTPAPDYNGPDALTFRANDGELDSNLATVAIDVRAVNDSPVVRLEPAGPVDEGAAPIELRAAATDVDGDTPSYRWSTDHGAVTGDGRFSDADGPATAHVAVLVIDGHGGSASATTPVEVRNVAPALEPPAPQEADEGATASFALGTLADPGDDSPWRVEVDWGDGAAEAFDAAARGPLAHAHTYDDDGIYTVRVTVRDDADFASIAFLVTVHDLAPTAAFGNDGPVDEGSAFHLALTDATDVSASDRAAGFAFAFDCGRGFGEFSPDATATCATDDNGTRSVAARVRDKDGAVREYAAIVEIHNLAPAVDAGPASVEQLWGLPVAFAGSASDASPVDLAAGLSPTWSFGDGTGAGGLAPLHAYDDPGDFDATLTATDKDGASASDSVHVRVLKRPSVLVYTGTTTAAFGYARLAARLTDAIGGSPLAGRTVGFTADGRTFTAVTDATGTAEVAPAAPLHTAAVHVAFAGDERYVSSTADASLTVSSTGGRVTGGILLVAGGNAGFNAQGGSPPQGDLQFTKDGAGFHAHDVSDIGIATDGHSAWLAGVGDDGRPYVVYAEDAAEPGSYDRFRLWIAGVLQTGDGRLDGGNVQIHPPRRG